MLRLLNQFLLAVLLLSFPIYSYAKSSDYPQLKDNPFIDKTIKKAIKPYVLDPKHPAKQILDEIFSTKRATLNHQAMEEAGFTILYQKSRSYIVVARHPKLQGYLIKAHLDTESRKKRGKPGWKWFVQRCRGARNVSKAIRDCNSKFFQVPKKWIYPLPVSPLTADGLQQHPTILIVQDMDLASEEENHLAWHEKITKKHLNELYKIIKNANGSSYRPDNIWISKNGKFSFIDTEYPDNGPEFKGVASALSPEMQKYWHVITH